MRDYTRLSDAVLLRELAARVAEERVSTATVVALIAEVDVRRLYAPAGYSSMHVYCVEALHLSDDAAYKRIQAARAARRFPILLEALADGRLHLTAVCLLAPHLAMENAEELVEGATHARKPEIEDFLARRFAPPEPARTVPAGGPRAGVSGQAALELAPEQVDVAGEQLAPEQVGVNERSSALGGTPGGLLAPAQVRGPDDRQLAPEQVEAPQVQTAARLAERLVQISVRMSTHDKLRHAQALLSHAIPSGDVSEVLERALNLLIAQVEKRKLGTGTRKPAQRRSTTRTRYVPAQVRRAVWERDRGQCTFVGANGHRCNARRFLEFDHAEPFARGGRATVDGMRLRCRVHNQYEAERTFGAEFMNRKREVARMRRSLHVRGAL